uniref:FAS1 domain-containing protein n=1 Tax=Salix viminalis TaxID=40686 RepID=A0A6N2L6Y6_SALVM
MRPQDLMINNATSKILLHLLLLLSLLHQITTATLTDQQLELALLSLRSHGYTLFPNAISTSDLRFHLLNQTSNATSTFTLFSPPDSLLFSVDLSSTASHYTKSLFLHVSPSRLSISDLFLGPDIAVHGLDGILVAGFDDKVEDTRLRLRRHLLRTRFGPRAEFSTGCQVSSEEENGRTEGERKDRRRNGRNVLKAHHRDEDSRWLSSWWCEPEQGIFEWVCVHESRPSQVSRLMEVCRQRFLLRGSSLEGTLTSPSCRGGSERMSVPSA